MGSASSAIGGGSVFNGAGGRIAQPYLGIPHDRSIFLEIMTKAFKKPLSNMLASKLCHAYSRELGGRPDSFTSKCKMNKRSKRIDSDQSSYPILHRVKKCSWTSISSEGPRP